MTSVDLWAGGEQTGHPIQWPETDAVVIVDDDRDGVNANDDFMFGCNAGLGKDTSANWFEDNSHGYGGTLMYLTPGSARTLGRVAPRPDSSRLL